MEVSIVGKSKGFEEYEKAGGHIWCVSSVFQQLKKNKVDMIFNLHKPEIWEYWLPSEKARVVVAFPDLGFHNVYPVKKMLDKYGAVFGSSIAWMIALAIEMGYKKINIFGVDMGAKIEYIEQRDTFFYWCGRAEALGVEIFIPNSSRTFYKDRIYGVL